MAARIEEHIDPVPDAVLPARDELLARIAAARARLAVAPPLHQASLFDRRAELEAGSRREVAAYVDAALSRRAASLMVTGSHTSHQRLIAVWPRHRKP